MSFRFALIAVAALALGSWQNVRAEDPPAASQPAAQPVDYHKLKEIMPDKLGGQPRGKVEGQKVSAGAMVISNAKAEYAPKESADNAPHLDVEIVDYVATPAMAAGAAAWQNIQIDNESDTGWEKTTKVAGNPAMESYKNDARQGEATVFVASRFIVTLKTEKLSSDDFKKAVEELPLAKLAELK